MLTQLLNSPAFALTFVPLLPLLGFVINGLWGRRMTPTASGTVACLTIGLSFVLGCVAAWPVLFGVDGGAQVPAITSQILGGDWIQTDWLTITMGLRLDRLSTIMLLVITGVGSLIHIYSVGYMAHDKAYWRYFAYLNLFCFAMLCLVLGDNLVLLFLGWEGVGLCSYLLIGFWYDDEAKAKAGKKAFVVNRIGDLGFLIGMFLLAWHFGTLDTAAMTDLTLQGATGTGKLTAAHAPLLSAACLCLFIGATGKSAQIPLYVWLPDAMAGPTPVSALIHAATMVTAGVYMLSRLSAIFALTWVLDVVAIVGGLTALFAGSIALVQRDIKKVLAYSTVSQLGFMFMAAGCGAFAFAIFHLVTHAFFKALLFLGSGSVIHALEHGYGHGNPDAQDLRLMGGLARKMPATAATMFVGGLALAGIPLFAGFFSKDEILLAAFENNKLVYALGVGAAAMTAFYTARLLALTFFGSFRGERKIWDHVQESPRVMTLPLVILAMLSIVGGFMNIPHNLGHLIGREDLDFFHRFLTPVFAPAEALAASVGHGAAAAHGVAEHAHEHGAAWMNMLLSSAIAIVMFTAALRYYRREGALTRADTRAQGPLKPVFNALLNKYWVDEVYEFFFVRMGRMFAQLLFVGIDMVLIDLALVNGSAFGLGAMSHVMRRIQTGVVTHYLYVFGLAASGLLLWLMLAA